MNEAEITRRQKLHADFVNANLVGKTHDSDNTFMAIANANNMLRTQLKAEGVDVEALEKQITWIHA